MMTSGARIGRTYWFHFRAPTMWPWARWRALICTRPFPKGGILSPSKGSYGIARGSLARIEVWCGRDPALALRAS